MSHVLPAATWFPREKLAKDASVYEHMTANSGQAAAFSLLWLPNATSLGALKNSRHSPADR